MITRRGILASLLSIFLPWRSRGKTPVVPHNLFTIFVPPGYKVDYQSRVGDVISGEIIYVVVLKPNELVSVEQIDDHWAEATQDVRGDFLAINKRYEELVQ